MVSSAVSKLAIAVTVVTFVVVGNEAALGQCEGWSSLASGGQAGTDGDIYALTLFNGDLIAGGWYNTAGGQTVNNIARWDGSSWHPLVSGTQTGTGGGNFAVLAQTIYNGDLIVGGRFTTAGGQIVNRIARWDGSSWHQLLAGVQIGVSDWVLALTVYNGNLIAAGYFQTAGGVTVSRIARWNGSSWQPFISGSQIGLGGSNTPARAMVVYNGDLIVGGDFTTAGGQTVNSIARWDGSAWHPLASGGQIGVAGGTAIGVLALAVYRGDLIVGGDFTTAGGQTVNNIARWDGTSWHPIVSDGQTGITGDVHALAVYNGRLVVGANQACCAGGQTVNNFVRWNGSSWQPVSANGQIGTNNVVRIAAPYAGRIAVGGAFITAGGQAYNHIALWRDARLCGADVNEDFTVNVADLLAIINGWGRCPPSTATCSADVAPQCGDQVVNVADLLAVINAWGACP